MKLFNINRKSSSPVWGAAMIILLLAVVHASAMNSAMTGRSASAKDSIVVQKNFSNNRYRIRLYPNANHQVLFFSATGRAGKVYQLYLFDIEGKLVKRANIRNKETTVLNNIEKGSYVFEVFSDDERIENGQLFVK